MLIPIGEEGVAEITPVPTFFNKTYDETMGLMIEARDYISYGSQRDNRDMRPGDRLVISCETLRITSRLTQVMAWLLVQKAVHAGEMTQEQAVTEPYRLSGQSVCEDRDYEEMELLPRALRSLLERSYNLYVRVARLDALMGERLERLERPERSYLLIPPSRLS